MIPQGPSNSTRVYTRGVDLVHLAEDRRRFEGRLKAAFPTLRFLLLPVVRVGEEPRITYLDSTLEERAKNARLTAWLMPDGWQPRWGPNPHDPEIIRCENPPLYRFYLSPPEVPRTTYISRPLAQDPTQEVQVVGEVLGHGQLYGNWREDQPEVRRFLQQVIRLAKKDATNEIMGIDFTTGRPYAQEPLPKGGGMIWVGHAAAAWLRERPNRFVLHFRFRDEFHSYYWPLPTEDEFDGERDGRELPDPTR